MNKLLAYIGGVFALGIIVGGLLAGAAISHIYAVWVGGWVLSLLGF